MAKKTFAVEKLKAKINNRMMNPDVTVEEARGLVFVLESILHETGNYNGYSCVHWLYEGGCEAWNAHYEANKERLEGLLTGPDIRGYHDEKEPFINAGNDYRRWYY